MIERISSSDELAINVHRLHKKFGNKVAVDNVSIAQPRGSVWGFLGPNGSGKTTTIRMLCGLLSPTDGEGTCLGFDVLTESDKIKLHTGYMTQKFSFWEDLTIRENLSFVARLYQINDRESVINKTLQDLNLSHRQNQLTRSLSGGWKQRLALAAVTMHRPKLLLLDEPTAGVDPQARRDFWQQIHLLSQQGLTVLVSTHYMDEAERCDHIVYLAHGKLITQGSVPNIIKQSGLVAFESEGHADNINSNQIRYYLNDLSQYSNINEVSFAANKLKVSGYNQQGILSDLNEFNRQLSLNKQPILHWQVIQPNLEDAFIALEKQTGGDKR